MHYDPLSPFVSEVMRPQGILQEKKQEVPVARARYSKGRDTPSRGESEAHVSGRAHPVSFPEQLLHDGVRQHQPAARARAVA